MGDVALRVENLGKRYRLGQRQRYLALRDSLAQAMQIPVRALGSLLNGRSKENGLASDNYIWALKDVSFEVKLGESIGIIGRNGAGKSTLLKILSRITEPTEGYAEIHGRVGSLLEVGTGFHPELTGRENIYLNGAILGMKKAEIDRKFDEIVDFAEIDKFIDTPAKHYSSGMYMRLAFAVAAHLEPEVLVVDEVLAVGDSVFQKKSLGKMDEVTKEGRTVLFVSHQMAAVTRLCRQVIWIEAGQIRMWGPTEQVVTEYLTGWANREGEYRWEDGFANPGEIAFRLQGVCIRNEYGEITSKTDIRKPFWIELRYSLLEPLPFARVGVLIKTAQGFSVFEAYDTDDSRYLGPRQPGNYLVTCEIPGDLLNAERYFLSVNAGMPNVRNLAYAEGILVFDVEDTGGVGSEIFDVREGIIRPRLHWESEVLTK